MFGLLYKIYNIIFDISQQPPTINSYINSFRYDDYLANFTFNLLSYMIGVVAQLGKYCYFFLLKRERLGGLPLYYLIQLAAVFKSLAKTRKKEEAVFVLT